MDIKIICLLPLCYNQRLIVTQEFALKTGLLPRNLPL